MNTHSGSASAEERAPLRRLGQLIRFESGLLRRAIFLQAMQALSYIPFYAAVGIFIDKILRNETITIEDRHFWIVMYALGNLALWPIHSWFTVRAFARSQEIVRALTAHPRRDHRARRARPALYHTGYAHTCCEAQPARTAVG